MALAKLRWWLEDKSQMICFLKDFSLRKGYRGLQAYLKHGMTAKDGPEKTALRLCKLRGLVRERVAEENEDGEARLVSCAADGVGANDLKLLLAAGAEAVCQDRRAPLLAAAEAGQAEAVRVLLEAKANLEPRGEVRSFALYVLALSSFACPS